MCSLFYRKARDILVMSRYVQPSYGFRKQSGDPSNLADLVHGMCTNFRTTSQIEVFFILPTSHYRSYESISMLFFLVERAFPRLPIPHYFHSTIIRDSAYLPTPRVSHSPIGSIRFSRSLPINKMMSNFLFPQHASSTQSFCRRAFLEFKKLRFRKSSSKKRIISFAQRRLRIKSVKPN